MEPRSDTRIPGPFEPGTPMPGQPQAAQAPPPLPGSTPKIEGTIVRATEDAILLRDDEGRDYLLEVTLETLSFPGGLPASPVTLQEGERVRASWRLEEGKLRVVAIEPPLLE